MEEKGIKAPVLSSVFLTASLIGGAWVMIRIVMTGSLRYGFLLWNLGLAWVPLLLAWIIYQSGTGLTWGRYMLLFGGWALFYPNAPYMLTDLIHIPRTLHFPEAMETVRLMDWADLLLIGHFVILGYWIGLESLYNVCHSLKTRLGGLFSGAVLTTMAFLSGIGIYMGRFLRLNSWDVIHPEKVFWAFGQGIQGKGLVFSLMIGFFILLTYGGYRSIRGLSSDEEIAGIEKEGVYHSGDHEF